MSLRNSAVELGAMRGEPVCRYLCDPPRSPAQMLADYTTQLWRYFLRVRDQSSLLFATNSPVIKPNAIMTAPPISWN